MRDRQRRKAQSRINKRVRALNKNIHDDYLWRGRFFVRQVDANWDRFEDGSGGVLTVWLEIRDKKTGKYMGFAIDNYDRGWKLWTAGNEFIAEHSGVWIDIDEVKADKTDWDQVTWIPKEEILFRGY
jgi:hypothetical protein